METLRGYSLKGRKGLSRWDALLEEWLLAMERYSRIMDGEDAAYWYTERSSIGVLAGAAWRCGRIALEEFQQEKGYRNRQKQNGRCDLYIASEADEELVEAKLKWVSLRSNNVAGIANAVIGDAVRDAKRSRGNDTDANAIAVGFFPAHVSTRWINEVDDLIETAIEEFHNVDYHALAWSFPKENRKKSPSKEKLYPGVIMVVKNVDY